MGKEVGKLREFQRSAGVLGQWNAKHSKLVGENAKRKAVYEQKQARLGFLRARLREIKGKVELMRHKNAKAKSDRADLSKRHANYQPKVNEHLGKIEKNRADFQKGIQRFEKVIIEYWPVFRMDCAAKNVADMGKGIENDMTEKDGKIVYFLGKFAVMMPEEKHKDLETLGKDEDLCRRFLYLIELL